ncbi:MAG: hypothetical protein JXA21_01795 [Anaerolineae bacterium]|nr:hypothetical protein [Anaerolineae bacterium]
MVDKLVNVRLSNRVMWALEDIDAAALEAMLQIDKVITRAEEQCDPVSTLRLAKVKTELADIRVLAIAARGGEYAGKRAPEE